MLVTNSWPHTVQLNCCLLSWRRDYDKRCLYTAVRFGCCWHWIRFSSCTVRDTGKTLVIIVRSSTTGYDRWVSIRGAWHWGIPSAAVSRREASSAAAATSTPTPCELQSVVDASTVNTFKARLDKFWLHQLVKFHFTADLTGTGNRSGVVIT